MPAIDPVDEMALTAGTTLEWPEVLERLGAAASYWLATTHADGRPHVVPVLAVVTDGALGVAMNPTTRKAKNLARDPRCTVTASAAAVDLVVEGIAERVDDPLRLGRAATAYDAKYGWRVTVHEGAFTGSEGAPTAGPPPYHLYAVQPLTVFAFPTDGAAAATRWRFDAGPAAAGS